MGLGEEGGEMGAALQVHLAVHLGTTPVRGSAMDDRIRRAGQGGRHAGEAGFLADVRSEHRVRLGGSEPLRRFGRVGEPGDLVSCFMQEVCQLLTRVTTSYDEAAHDQAPPFRAWVKYSTRPRSTPRT